MQKQCPCGAEMIIKLRTVIYSGKVEIDNVPIYSCSSCNRSEVFPEVKPDLTGLIDQLGAKPDKQNLLFNEWNEWADLLVEVCLKKKQTDTRIVEQLIAERIDKLLDLYLVVMQQNDEDWMNEIRKRLTQLSRRPMHT
ncbi:hypothetical protein EBB07_32725 [Paenibacillaceae bacterium]|nr:hypothetical protein EBB07_32725 [Paenibacillaceae bacterium]